MTAKWVFFFVSHDDGNGPSFLSFSKYKWNEEKKEEVAGPGALDYLIDFVLAQKSTKNLH